MKRVKTQKNLNSQNQKKILNGQNAKKLKHKNIQKGKNGPNTKILISQNAKILKWSKR